ncbi:coenzyme F420-0:L-glutamate ligase [Pseudorhodoplanes sp.]|uniref:coenzyme F420-0:L-glutamate ligase n=1 Tax=Pseudorhodoplanes sp. TaxID=1934341 RepID=UPI003D0E9DCD
MKHAGPIELIPVRSFPLVRENDRIAQHIITCLEFQGVALQTDDILVIAQKVVSKAEGRLLNLSTIIPTERAFRLSDVCRKDPRLVQAILSESSEVLRCADNLLIVVHRLGFVAANAAIDASNVGANNENFVLLLPRDPDKSAVAIRNEIAETTGISVGIIINDSFGRAWRQGTIGTAIGAAGLPSLEDLRGRPDLFGRTLVATEVATADQLASAASLLQGQADEGIPVVLIRGFHSSSPHNSAAALIRPSEKDTFR